MMFVSAERQTVSEGKVKPAIRKRRNWTFQDKQFIVSEIEKGTFSTSAAARKYNIPVRLVFSWKRQFGKIGPMSLPPSKKLAFHSGVHSLSQYQYLGSTNEPYSSLRCSKENCRSEFFHAGELSGSFIGRLYR